MKAVSKYLVAMLMTVAAGVVIVVASPGKVGAEGAAAGKIRFYMPVSPAMKNSGLVKMLTDFTKVISQKTGMSFDIIAEVYDYDESPSEKTYNMFKAKKADFAYIHSNEYASNFDKYNKVMNPAMILVVNNSSSFDYCLYARKDGPVKTLEDAKNYTWGGSDTIMARVLLDEKGYDMPVSKFFKEVKFMDDIPITKAVEALAKGKIDCFSSSRNFLAISGNVMDSNGQKTVVMPREIACAKGPLNWIFVFGKNVPAAQAAMITQMLTSADRSPDFKNYRFLFMAIKGKFVKYNESDMARTRELARIEKAKGWDREKRELLKKSGYTLK